MDFNTNIEIYKVIMDFNSPLMINSCRVSNTKIGDYLLIFDDVVWIKDPSESNPNNFSRVLYSSEFVRINNKLFEKV